MNGLAPLPDSVSLSGEAERAHLARLLLGGAPDTIARAVAERGHGPLDRCLLAYGARLALDAWQTQPWTLALLERLTGAPSRSWRSVLLAVDAGVPQSAWALVHTLDDPSRRSLAQLDNPYLTLIAAAGLRDQISLPEVDPPIVALVRQVVHCRRVIGHVPRPWQDDFGDQLPVSEAASAAMQSLPPLVEAAGLVLPDDAEVQRVLSARIEPNDADWVVHALDEIAAQTAARLEPLLVGALPDHLRVSWTRAWEAWAAVLLRAVSADHV